MKLARAFTSSADASPPTANIAYNLYIFGGGTDFALTPTLNLRADYEFQNWTGFPIATLHPSLVTIGMAYHFRK
jgi:hypothetical protein